MRICWKAEQKRDNDWTVKKKQNQKNVLIVEMGNNSDSFLALLCDKNFLGE